MDFGTPTLDVLIEEEDLAEADKKKILQSKSWQEHIKKHPDAQLVQVEKEEILDAPEKPLTQPNEPTPPQSETPKPDLWWLDEEKKPALQEQPQPTPQTHETHKAIGWECKCGEAMKPPEEKNTGQAYKIQQDEEESGIYKTNDLAELYGRAENTETSSPGGAYLGGGEPEDHLNPLYRHAT